MFQGLVKAALTTAAGAAFLALAATPSPAFTLSAPSLEKPVGASNVEKAYYGYGWRGRGWGWRRHWGYGYGWRYRPWGYGYGYGWRYRPWGYGYGYGWRRPWGYGYGWHRPWGYGWRYRGW